ncbi:MAG: 2OG-Fe(II) oxygenase [Burkholderiaceae bacterium]|jgi:prolyl 4-hydroxylase|nr:2OG-Fe(II) oxygenase [Burkholderiaceae bacterium]
MDESPSFSTDGARSDAHPSDAVRRWVDEQRAAGVQRAAMHAALTAAGWEAAAATALLGHVLDGAHEPPPAPTRVPGPDLSGALPVLQAAGHAVGVQIAIDRPPLVVFSQLLSADECAALIGAARPRLARSLTVQTQTGGEEINADRTSEGMFFQRGENAVVQRLEERIAALLHWPVDHGEGLQVLRYGPGAQYKPHYDYFDPQEAGTASMLRRGGQRVATLVMYLNTPQAGGATVFPSLGLTVSPQRGNAVFFSYDRPRPDTRTLHGGAPVLAGEKWIATKWLREQKFE